MSLDGGSVEEEVRKLKWAHLSIRVQIFLLTACYIGCRTNCWSPSWSMIQTTLFCKCLLAWWCRGSMQDDEEVHAMSSNWTRHDNWIQEHPYLWIIHMCCVTKPSFWAILVKFLHCCVLPSIYGFLDLWIINWIFFSQKEFLWHCAAGWDCRISFWLQVAIFSNAR